jgi:hypothetical protein
LVGFYGLGDADTNSIGKASKHELQRREGTNKAPSLEMLINPDGCGCLLTQLSSIFVNNS